MIKKVLFPLFSVFLALRSFELVKSIAEIDPAKLGVFTTLGLAAILNLFITGIFAFVGFAYKTSMLLPNSYYAINKPEILKKIYKLLGIKYFKWFLLKIFWGKKENKAKYFNGSKSGLEQFDFQTRQSEFGHLGAVIIVTVVSILLFYKSHFTLAIITLTINLIFNLYPIILQRMHRLQIERIASIAEKRSTPTSLLPQN